MDLFSFIFSGLFSSLPYLIPIAVIALILKMGYIKAPPDEAHIISGFRKKIIVGQSAIRIPYLERVDRLSLNVMTVDVKTGEFVPTNDFINVMVDAVVKIQISSEPELLDLAAKNFLNRPPEYIIEQVNDVLEGNLREIIGQLTLPSMVQDRKSFGERVQENAVPDLEKMGLELVAFNIQSFQDDNDIIRQLGAENEAEISKDASIARARAEKEIAIAQAQSKKESRNEEIIADQVIAEKENELKIRRSELQEEADKRKAQADVAYEIQQEISRKDREEKTAEANLMKEQRAIEIQKATLDATIKQQADVENYRRLKEADALYYEQEREAQAVKVKAESDAESVRLRGQADADAVRELGLAEAEAIDKKAEAMQKYEQAAIIEMYLEKLPLIAESISKPLQNVDKITMYGDGNNEKFVGEMTKMLTNFTDGVGDGMGLDVKSMIAGAFGNSVMNKASQNAKDVDTIDYSNIELPDLADLKDHLVDGDLDGDRIK